MHGFKHMSTVMVVYLPESPYHSLMLCRDTNVVNHLRMLWKEGGRRSLWAGEVKDKGEVIVRVWSASAMSFSALGLAMLWDQVAA